MINFIINNHIKKKNKKNKMYVTKIIVLIKNQTTHTHTNIKFIYIFSPFYKMKPNNKPTKHLYTFVFLQLLLLLINIYVFSCVIFKDLKIEI